MSSVKRIVKNTGILFISNIISKFFGFVCTTYTARYLGAEGFGVLSFALAFTGMFSVLADMGLHPLTIREVARNTKLAGKYLGNIAVMKSILGIITFILIVLTINLMNYPVETVYIVYLIAFYVLMNSLNNMFYSIYQGHEKTEYVGIGNILNSSLMLLGVFIAMYFGFNVEGFAYIYLISGIMVLLYNLIVSAWKFVKPKIEVDLKFWKELLKEAWPFALTGTFINVYLWIDSVMLSYMKGNEVVGWYSAAYRLVLILLFIPVVFDSAIFPVMARAYISEKEILKIILEKYFKLMLIIGILIGIVVTMFSDDIILLIYGDKYSSSIPALQVLIWTLVLVFLRVPFERLFEASNKQTLVTKAFGYSVVFNIILNYILIPKYSYIGAGIATVLTDLMVLILVVYMFLNMDFKNTIFTKKNIKIFLSIVIVGIISGFIVKYIRLSNIILTMVFFVITYFVILYLTRVITEDEMQEIMKKLK